MKAPVSIEIKVVLHMVQEMSDEQWDIFVAIPQRWEEETDHTESVEEIFPESTGPHFIFKASVCGRYDSYIYWNRFVGPDTANLSLLKDAQKLWLEIKREFSKFIEENRTTLSHLKETLSGHDRASKAALFVTEKLALDEAFRNGPAIKDDEGFVAAATHLVDRLSDHLFSCSRFPFDDYSGRCGGNFLQDVEDLPHFDGSADNIAETLVLTRFHRDLFVDR